MVMLSISSSYSKFGFAFYSIINSIRGSTAIYVSIECSQFGSHGILTRKTARNITNNTTGAEELQLRISYKESKVGNTLYKINKSNITY